MSPRVMPRELAIRGHGGAEALCARLTAEIASDASGPVAETPDAIFSRLARRPPLPPDAPRDP